MRLLLPFILATFMYTCNGVQEFAPEDQPLHDILRQLGEDPYMVIDHMNQQVAPLLEERFNSRIINGSLNGTITCDGCLMIVDALNLHADLGYTFEDLRPDFMDLCNDFVNITFGPRGLIMCPGIVDLQLFHVYRIISERDITAEDACVTLNFCLQSEIEPGYTTFRAETAEGTGYDVIAQPEGQVYSTEYLRRNSLRIVQLADIHVDHHYTQGAPTDCGLPVCCRTYWPGEGSAPKWGTTSCNTPPRTINHFLDQVRSLNPDIVFYTGDSPPHSLWNETLDSQLSASRMVADMMKDKLSGIPMYAAIGNHETQPTNLYHVTLPETPALNQAFTQWWTDASQFGPEQISTIQDGGYYAMTLRPDLRLISINSDFGYNMNFYILWSRNEAPYTTMQQFVQNELLAARNANQKVIVLCHHPTGSNTMDPFSTWLSETMLEYADTIVLSLHGHTHRDEFRVVRTPADAVPRSIQYIAPSMTPYPTINPSARVYYLDPNTFTVLDYEQYYMDLQKANATADNALPEIELTYRATQEYELPDLSPVSWNNHVNRMATDDAMFQKWRRNHVARSGEEGECDQECRIEALCRLRETVHSLYRTCIDQGTP